MNAESSSASGSRMARARRPCGCARSTTYADASVPPAPGEFPGYAVAPRNATDCARPTTMPLLVSRRASESARPYASRSMITARAGTRCASLTAVRRYAR